MKKSHKKKRHYVPEGIVTKAIRFEDLDCWQLSKDLAIELYKISSQGKVSKDFGLRNQLRKSAISIISNIAEGKERGSASEFIRFLYIAKSSAAELRTQLTIAKEVGFFNESNFQNLLEKTVKISFMISSLIKSIRKRKK